TVLQLSNLHLLRGRFLPPSMPLRLALECLSDLLFPKRQHVIEESLGRRRCDALLVLLDVIYERDGDDGLVGARHRQP
ncbi:hypothetical protein PENTCL1PPCAC_19275, partial [Pristionchus entomophagus]